MQVLQVQLEIRPDPAEVGRARRWARSRLAGSGVADDEPLAETLILLVSELVTNAVVHTGCPAVLRLSFAGECGSRSGAPGVAGGIVRLEVVDLSDCPPVPRHAEGDETNGRGLELVDGLADRWGWSAEGVGKRIWCELDRCPAPAPASRGGGSSVAAPAAASVATPVVATAASARTASAYGGMAAYEAV
ncbi:ATP-binding protein [Streptomyces sp. QTS52]